VPTTYKGIFPELAKIGVLPHDLAHELEKMAGFRNILVHLYMKVDLQKVYDYMQNDLEKFEQFAQYVSQYLNP